MKTWKIIAVAVLVLIPVAFAQNPIESVMGPAKEQVNKIGQQLQQKAVMHIVEANLTQQQISHEFNATKQNLTTQVVEKLNQTLNGSLNLTPEELQQKAFQRIVEANLTREHISQEFNATEQNLTKQAAEKLNQTLNESLNLTPEQLQQNITEELKKRLNQRVPGFEVLTSLIGLVCLALAIGRKN